MSFMAGSMHARQPNCGRQSENYVSLYCRYFVIIEHDVSTAEPSNRNKETVTPSTFFIHCTLCVPNSALVLQTRSLKISWSFLLFVSSSSFIHPRYVLLLQSASRFCKDIERNRYCRSKWWRKKVESDKMKYGGEAAENRLLHAVRLAFHRQQRKKENLGKFSAISLVTLA